MILLVLALVIGAAAGHAARRSVPAVLRLRDRSLPFATPWLELSTAALFAATFWRFGWRAGPWPFLVVLLLVTITACDYLLKLIPDLLIVPTVLVALLWSAVDPAFLLELPFHRFLVATLAPNLQGGAWEGLLLSASGALVGFTLLEVIRRGFGKLAGLEVMGLGDCKLAAALGAILGPAGILTALPLAFILGVAHGLIFLRATGQPHSPFGPALALAGWLTLVLRARLLSWIGDFQRMVLSLPLGVLAAGYTFLLAIAIGLIWRTRRKAREYEELIEEDYRRVEERLED